MLLQIRRPNADPTNFLKIEELKGANSNELRTQVDLLLFQAFPRR